MIARSQTVRKEGREVKRVKYGGKKIEERAAIGGRREMLEEVRIDRQEQEELTCCRRTLGGDRPCTVHMFTLVRVRKQYA